jgi:hypothetical protein
MIRSRTVRPGAASLALLLIFAITAAWWALALWPAGAVEPAWLLRTRAACFGSAPGGLPDAGGWILLIGEPIGMLGVLLVVWGGALRDDLRRMRADRRWRWITVAAALAVVLGVAAFGRRMAFATGLGTAPPATPSGTPSLLDVDVSAFALTDQHGRRASLADYRRAVLLPCLRSLHHGLSDSRARCPARAHGCESSRSTAPGPDPGSVARYPGAPSVPGVEVGDGSGRPRALGERRGG